MNAIIKDIKTHLKKQASNKQTVVFAAIFILVSQGTAAAMLAYLSIPLQSLLSFTVSVTAATIASYIYIRLFIPVTEKEDLLSIPPKVVSKR